MFSLPPPRHISTLPTRKSRDVCFRAAVRGIADANALVQLLLDSDRQQQLNRSTRIMALQEIGEEGGHVSVLGALGSRQPRHRKHRLRICANCGS
jgi:hypothetical protein